jgi:hypothetical protein
MHNPATSFELADLLGEVDPFVIEQILATGATLDEVDAALAIVSAGRAGDRCETLPGPRIEAVRAILEELYEDTGEYPAYPSHDIA